MNRLTERDLAEQWASLNQDERTRKFRSLPRIAATAFLVGLSAAEQALLLTSLPPQEQEGWLRGLPPRSAAALIRALPAEQRPQFLKHLEAPKRADTEALLGFAAGEAGGLVNPEYARVSSDASVDEAITYLRNEMLQHVSAARYVYVVDPEQRLVGVLGLRDLFTAAPGTSVKDVMRSDVIHAEEKTPLRTLRGLMKEHHLLALPVVDEQGRMTGLVGLTQMVDAIEAETTRDMQRLGGAAALDEPYLTAGARRMIRKRAGWLSALFLGEMLTATAMGYFEHEIERAVVLALFVPLIISSGGNSGSQATTLVIRAMALGEVRLGDFLQVIRRELFAGVGLGCILGTIGLCRILLWHFGFGTYGEHFFGIGITVALSLVGVVLWGALAGAALPFALRRMGFDPASASAPFVATIVDVSGLVIYFSIASLVLQGTLL
ncbi:MAG TPA: magnesium transporter [Polyangiales bacterium]